RPPQLRRYRHATERAGSIRRTRVERASLWSRSSVVRIVGFIDARLEQSPDPMHREVIYCQVAEIAVKSRHRNQGIGGVLLRAAEDWGRRHGEKFAYLEYHAANTSASRFYQQRMCHYVASITAIKPL